MSERICLTLRQFKEMNDLHPVLWELVEDTLVHWPGERMEVTCIFRTPEEEETAGGKSGVHMTNPHRAIDLRIKNLVGDYQLKANALAETLNSLWIYDPTRPNLKVAISKVHGSGPHVHLQVSNNTERKPLF